MSNAYDYDAIIIGGGAAGLTAAGLAANFGAKTMMVEARRLGGDCTWTGCVPSKALLKAGKIAHHIRQAEQYGLVGSTPEIDGGKIMEHVRSIREQMYEEADRPGIYEAMGIEVVGGRARFVDDHSISILQENGSEQVVSARYFFICTGAGSFIPEIEGIESVPYLTSETLFEINELPEDLVIFGAGPVGNEMAQAFTRLGSRVRVAEMADRIMRRDDPELAGRLCHRLEKEGVEYLLGAEIKKTIQKDGKITVDLRVNGEHRLIRGDALLVATGRRANIKGLGLEHAGVRYSQQGISINNRGRTNIPHIYACGDVTGHYHLTHMSEHMAKVAVTNALIKYPLKIDAGHVPWCTYTDPELGHVGAPEEELRKQGRSFETYRFPYTKIDRAVADSEKDGLIKIRARKWDGKILGASVFGARAGELISEYAVAMKNGVSLRKLADTIHPYPSYGLGARRAADQWYIRNQSAWQVKLFRKLFGYRGPVPDFSDPDRIV